MADEDQSETDFGLFTTDARFSVEDGEPVVRGIMLEPGAFQTSRGARIVTPAFIAKTMHKWVGKRMCVVDASHPDKPPVTVDVARIMKTGVNSAGQGVFEARPFKTTLARDTWELAREYGKLGVSIDGPISVAADRKTMLDIEPRYLAILPMGDQAIPASYMEVGKFSAADGAFDSLLTVESSEGKEMTDEEIQKVSKERDEAAKRASDAEAKFATANDELVTVKAQRDTLLKEKNEAERLGLLDETAKFAKKFGESEPAKDAMLEALRALRAGFAEKALAKFAEGKSGADLQKTVPPAAGEKQKEPAAKPRRIFITD